ncbi:uncharacterized protein FoxP isoform X3 [Chironomus tepperi]|uniref:uncharacterized protein FoxP isoform X3 n=1 Tax=Chironomus tepperi TaxID=113505 RepID=UPI00391F5482
MLESRWHQIQESTQHNSTNLLNSSSFHNDLNNNSNEFYENVDNESEHGIVNLSNQHNEQAMNGIDCKNQIKKFNNHHDLNDNALSSIDEIDSDDQMDGDDCKSHVTFSITDSIKKSSRSSSTAGTKPNDSNNNLNDISSNFNDFCFPADQNNNDSKKVDEKSEIFHAKLRNLQMQQLLQQHVFSPHQLQQLIVNQPAMSSPKESLFHFEQKRKQMEMLMHQIQEQLHANILQQTHLLQQQSPNGENNLKKNSSTFQLQQKLAIQQQELAQQFQLIQRQYLLHQSGMQLLFPQHHQQIQNLSSHCADFQSPNNNSNSTNNDDVGHKTHSSDTQKGHLFDNEMNAKLNFKSNDTNNNGSSTTNENESIVKDKDEIETKDDKVIEINGNRDESPKSKLNDIKSGNENENCISQFLNSIINFRRDEMNLSLNNLLSGGNAAAVPPNFLLNDLNRNFLTTGFGQNEHMNHALSNLVAGHQQYQKYGRGTCKWPGCDLVFDDLQTFTKHLNTEHSMDDCTTAQARIQMQVVFQLEIQLQKEKDRLQAMMHHLHLTKESMAAAAALEQRNQNHPKSDGSSKTPIIDEQFIPSQVQNQSPQQPSPTSQQIHQNSRIRSPLHNVMPIRRRITDKSAMSLSGLPYMLERAGLDVQQEIQRNREFYKNADVRPPFTYASLIRQSIIESPDKQLTLNEIYNWFQNTFCYFRRNAATWKDKNSGGLKGDFKNAIRTNLSLHKCFVRYEDDFGSFWMVDDNEFVKRRHLSRGRPRNSQAPSGGNGVTQDSDGTTTGAYRSPTSSTPSSNYCDPNDANVMQNDGQIAGVGQNLQRGPRSLHSPSQNQMYGENMALNLQNFWLSPSNLLDDNGTMINHIKHDKFRSQSLSPSRSPNGVQNFSNSHEKLDQHMDMMNAYSFDHHRRKSRLSPRSLKERFYHLRNDNLNSPEESENASSAAYHNHHAENLVKHEVVSNYDDDEDEKMEDEVEDLSKSEKF